MKRFAVDKFPARLVLMIAIAAGAAAAVDPEEERAGTVVRLQGSAIAIQDALPRILAKNSEILVGDVISTGKDSRLLLKMIDGAEFTLGARTNFVVMEYAFRGDSGGAALRLMTGAINIASGKIGKLAGNTFRLETNVATIGIRGTKFWGGDLDGATRFVLFEGAVSVENRAGRVELTEPLTGTGATSRDTAPAAPGKWASGRLERALATVRFR